MNSQIKKLLLGVLIISFILPAVGQVNESANNDTIKFIPVSKIPDYQIKAKDKFFEVNKLIADTSDISVWQKSILRLEIEIKDLEQIFDSLDITVLTTEQLQKWNRNWIDIENGLNLIYKPLDEKIDVFLKTNNEIDILYHLWLETTFNIKNINISDILKISASETKLEARNLKVKIREDESRYISLKYDCNILFSTTAKKRRAIDIARENIVKNLLVAEQPVIWKSIFEYYADTIPKAKYNRFEDVSGNISDYTKSDPSYLYIILSVFVLLFLFIRSLQKSLKKSIDVVHDKETMSLGLIINKPIVISMLITWLLISSVYMPVEIRGIIMLVMLIPVLIIIKQFFGKQSIIMIILFVLYYLYVSTKFLFYSNSILPRIVYLFVAIFSVVFVWHLLKNKEFINKFEKLGWFIKIILNLELIVFFVSAIFYVLGNVTLASMLLSGAIGVILGGVILYSVYKLLYLIIEILIENEFLQKSHIVKNHPNEIKHGLRKIVAFLFFVHWANISLKGFGIKSEVISGIKEFFTQQHAIGSMSFSLDNLISFILAIYISIWVSRFLLIILKEEVFVRSKTDKGVSSTITLLLRYSIMTFGFIFALAVAGIKLSNISIIIGALGVGIGFGLQDIFNNLISGIILVIERPIKVDDIIQVGELTGVVKDIGFRSSKVRTYDGSEVIVPNGHIVSNQMINWTLSDRKRRLKINVSVSYDTNPEDVIEILKEITENHPNVEKNPAPRPRFLGFGDSTLDFQLLFWISDFDNSFGMGTEITLDLYKKLKERGITIPYPKQDIRIIKEE